MNRVYENTLIQGCIKICHSNGGSCGEKLKKITFGFQKNDVKSRFFQMGGFLTNLHLIAITGRPRS
jgi:hypothetical protein